MTTSPSGAAALHSINTCNCPTCTWAKETYEALSRFEQDPSSRQIAAVMLLLEAMDQNSNPKEAMATIAGLSETLMVAYATLKLTARLRTQERASKETF